jgi:hypothetical protein
MPIDLLQSLENLLATKMSRLSLARSFRSREVLKRQIHTLRQQMNSARTRRLL